MKEESEGGLRGHIASLSVHMRSHFKEDLWKVQGRRRYKSFVCLTSCSTAEEDCCLCLLNCNSESLLRRGQAFSFKRNKVGSSGFSSANDVF